MFNFAPSLTRRIRAWFTPSRNRTIRRQPGSVKLEIQSLEDRLVPASFAEAGTLLNLDLDVANTSVAIVSAGTSYSLTLTGDTWSGTDSANVTGNGTAVLTVTAAGLAAFNTVNITDSAAISAVNFNDRGPTYTQTTSTSRSIRGPPPPCSSMAVPASHSPTASP
jgi:hypothetical protein